VSGLVSYGGDRSVTVARSEIERITANLATIQTRLTDELQPIAQLNGLIHHLQLDAHLPETMIRLGLQRHGCFIASESYFTGDARIAHHLAAVADAIHSHPWLQRLIPNPVWVGLATTVGLSALSNSNLTALGVRAVVGEFPADKIGNSISKLPNVGVKLLPITPVKVYQSPRSLTSLASRLNNESGNIRLESYQTNKGRLVVVYLPGTSDWNPVEGKKAFDVRSDVELLGNGEKSTSYRAANAALDAFGVTSSDRLIVVGYSQGGMVASELAESHKNVDAIVTLGSPIAKEEIPSGVKVISLEHSNDVVPALSGATNPMTENWATASRHVDVNPGETILKAHGIHEYVQTAALADESTDAGLLRLRGEVLSGFAGATLLEAKEFSALKAAS
jgi:hypothetical protein